jgi:hypothetical protein
MQSILHLSKLFFKERGFWGFWVIVCGGAACYLLGFHHEVGVKVEF